MCLKYLLPLSHWAPLCHVCFGSQRLYSATIKPLETTRLKLTVHWNTLFTHIWVTFAETFRTVEPFVKGNCVFKRVFFFEDICRQKESVGVSELTCCWFWWNRLKSGLSLREDSSFLFLNNLTWVSHLFFFICGGPCHLRFLWGKGGLFTYGQYTYLWVYEC